MVVVLEEDQGNNYDMSSAMAKLYASKVAMEHTVEAVQTRPAFEFGLFSNHFLDKCYIELCSS